MSGDSRKGGATSWLSQVAPLGSLQLAHLGMMLAIVNFTLAFVAARAE